MSLSLNEDAMKSRHAVEILREITVGGSTFGYFSLPAAARDLNLSGLLQLPFSLRVLAENLLRHGSEVDAKKSMIAALARRDHGFEIPFHPARVLLQDLLGVPLMVDFAGLREAIAAAGKSPQIVNPKIPVDFVIDHSVIADIAGTEDAAKRNIEIEYIRNRERFEFLAWCQHAFTNFRVVPPDSGIVHQINVERLASVVWTGEMHGKPMVYPDTLVCNDSHAPMVNGIGVLGWGVGGIEAESAMLGRSVWIPVPRVVGVRVTGALPPGAVATDLVLRIAEVLRQAGVVGKFVEFFGPGLDQLGVAERITIANMAPEYGATCVYFPIDQKCMDYLIATGRDGITVTLAKKYARAQGLWRDASTDTPHFDAELELDLARVDRCVAGPRRPHERVPLDRVASGFMEQLPTLARNSRATAVQGAKVSGGNFTLGDGDIVIAAITSCTNTSNPVNMITAGLLAQKAVARGLKAAPWVKTSLAPGSRVVSRYLKQAGLEVALSALGFQVVGFGCTSCNGNSGPLAPEIEAAIRSSDTVSVAVLSGNRNFEGRTHPLARAAYLASPPLVVAYAIAGTIRRNLATEPLGNDSAGNPVYLSELWPTVEEVERTLAANLSADLYRSSYRNLFEGTPEWQALKSDRNPLYPWRDGSTFLRRPPFFDIPAREPRPVSDLIGLRALAILGDMVTTDHISPNNTIALDSPGGRYLEAHGVPVSDFQTYGFRRGNHEMALRGTFASSRLKNRLADGIEGGYTRLQPEGTVLPIFDAAEIYRARGVPLVIVAGRDYGAGSSRDWAAKGPALLGVRVVIAESFERIHRSNLIGVGILPLQLNDRRSDDLALDGTETLDVMGVTWNLRPGAELTVCIRRSGGSVDPIPVTSRIDTDEELTYFKHGGILAYVYRELVNDN